MILWWVVALTSKNAEKNLTWRSNPILKTLYYHDDGAINVTDGIHNMHSLTLAISDI